jgi:hypothetical protein
MPARHSCELRVGTQCPSHGAPVSAHPLASGRVSIQGLDPRAAIGLPRPPLTHARDPIGARSCAFARRCNERPAARRILRGLTRLSVFMHVPMIEKGSSDRPATSLAAKAYGHLPILHPGFGAITPPSGQRMECRKFSGHHVPVGVQRTISAHIPNQLQISQCENSGPSEGSLGRVAICCRPRVMLLPAAKLGLRSSSEGPRQSRLSRLRGSRATRIPHGRPRREGIGRSSVGRSATGHHGYVRPPGQHLATARHSGFGRRFDGRAAKRCGPIEALLADALSVGHQPGSRLPDHISSWRSHEAPGAGLSLRARHPPGVPGRGIGSGPRASTSSRGCPPCPGPDSRDLPQRPPMCRA